MASPLVQQHADFANILQSLSSFSIWLPRKQNNLFKFFIFFCWFGWISDMWLKHLSWRLSGIFEYKHTFKDIFKAFLKILYYFLKLQQITLQSSPFTLQLMIEKLWLINQLTEDIFVSRPYILHDHLELDSTKFSYVKILYILTVPLDIGLQKVIHYWWCVFVCVWVLHKIWNHPFSLFSSQDIPKVSRITTSKSSVNTEVMRRDSPGVKDCQMVKVNL